MNVIELAVFLCVTASGGAIIGAIIGWCTGNPRAGATCGAIVGPVASAVVITVYIWISNLNKRRQEAKQNRAAIGAGKKS